MTLTLISHALCPYVQRAVIALLEKQVSFRRIDIDLRNQPKWFEVISQLGKTPVLMAEEQPIFESAVLMRNASANVQEAIVPQAGHWLMEESADAIIALVVEFLAYER